MNIIKIEQFGEIEAIKLGYGPIGPPFMSVYFYILDGLVIDTGQRHMQKTVIELLREKKLRRILLTHHHEDHSGNASAICRHHHIEAFGHPLTVQKMATPFRIPPYQHYIWGRSESIELSPLGPAVESNRYKLVPVHTPGHSKDHTVFLEQANGWLFSGDLYLGQRIKFFRADEKIYEQIDSLKKVLKLDFDALFCAHNPCPQNGKSKLAQKLQFLEDIVGQVQKLKTTGLSLKAIVKRMDSGNDKWIKLMTMGNVSFGNMLRSAHQSEGEP
jgi:glyoxylase-like metal-dependent hydrolase (beta-lactamase superfamily II)